MRSGWFSGCPLQCSLKPLRSLPATEHRHHADVANPPNPECAIGRRAVAVLFPISGCLSPQCSLKRRLAAQNLRLEVSDAALDLIAESGFDPIYGARPLKRAIQAEIENPLAKALLNGQYVPESTIRIDAQGEHLIFA